MVVAAVGIVAVAVEVVVVVVTVLASCNVEKST